MGAYSLAAATETERVEPQGSPAVGSASRVAGAFEALSQWLLSRPLPNAALVSGPDLSVFAIADHVARCLAGLRVVRGAGALGVEGFVDVLRSLTESVQSEGPRSVRVVEGAARISPLELASKLRALVEQSDCNCLLVVDSIGSTFGRQVFAEAAKLGTPVVWVVGSAGPLSPANFIHFELPATLEAADVARWWSVAAQGVVSQVTEGSIEQLEMWWRRSARGLAKGAAPHHNELAARLRLVGRAVPVHLLSTLLGSDATSQLDELEGDPSVDRTGAWFFARPVAQPERMSAEARDAGVLVLERLASSGAAVDAWALLRAAELAYAVPAGAGEAVDLAASSRGDQLALRAVSSAPDAAARGEFWQRVLHAMPAVAGDASLRTERIALLPSWVEFALGAGDADVALRLARQLCELDGGADRPQHVLLLGRALSATGDLSAATGLLERVANDAAVGPASRARAAVELAEARYFSNDLAGAAEAAGLAATSAAASPESGQARTLFLDARNVQGKLLLASGDFVHAERHFVADACDAAILGERSLELRARANRAIAVMSQGRRSEAQSMLEAILHDAEELGELRAIGIALINLAPLAIFDHRYMDALELSERSVEVLRRIGDKVRLARVVANLAELRLRLGLVDEAAHAIRFALPVFRGGPPAERVWHSSLLLGRVALAKGDTASAQRYVNDALAAVGAGNVLRLPPGDPSLANVARGPVHSRICDALLVGARAALEDGDVVRAELYASRADTDRVPPRSAASVLLCRALLARAKGEEFLPAATSALQAARELDDDELLIEGHLLLHQAYVLTGARTSAKHHLASAISTRDRVSEPLSPELRIAFLSRRDLLELARAQQTFEGDEALSWDSPSPRSQGLSSVPSSGPGSMRAEGRVESAREPGLFVGSHPTMKALQNAVRKVGSSDSTVLIHGESGTGKELVAEALHQCSHRAKGPLVKVNCAALVETLLLSELFGYEKGAFTGAASRRRGRFEAAEGGTLFLDEIGDISARTQVALLRVLQEKTFERVGGNTSVRADVRIVCATHRDLKALVEAGQFREDLYYRLCGIVLQVPALRKRRSDIGALSSILLNRIAEERGGSVKKLSQRALLALGTHTWPGNVRELENALRAASVFAEGNEIELEDFAENVESLRHLADSSLELTNSSNAQRVLEVPRVLSAAVASSPGSLGVGADVAPTAIVNSTPSSLAQPSAPAEVAYAAVRGGISLHDLKRTIERDCIARALAETSGNITRAAAVLGMKRPRLSQLVKQYELGAQLDGAPASDDFDSAAAEEE